MIRYYYQKGLIFSTYHKEMGTECRNELVCTPLKDTEAACCHCYFNTYTSTYCICQVRISWHSFFYFAEAGCWMLIFVSIYYSQKYPDADAPQRLQNTVNKYSLIYVYTSTYWRLWGAYYYIQKSNDDTVSTRFQNYIWNVLVRSSCSENDSMRNRAQFLTHHCPFFCLLAYMTI